MRPLLVLTIFSALLFAGGCRRQPALAGGRPVGHWVQALQDPDARQRKTAAHKLGNAGAVDATVVAALTAAVRDPDAAVRAEAVLALGKFGPSAGDAVPVLRAAANEDPDARVRDYAADALARIQEQGLPR